jgi:hypothetical protein
MKILLLLTGFFLAGCATPYQSSSFMGGFDETKLSKNSYQVNFKGNKYSSTQRAIDFTLLRSAELTLESGYTYFVVIDSQNRTQKSLDYIPGSLNVAPKYKVSSSPSTTNTIQMLTSEPDGIFSYHAPTVAAGLIRKYGIE